MNNYVKNTSWILIEKMSRIISGLLVGVLVARYLGPSQLGLISYALSMVAVFTIFSTMGLDGIIVREIINRKQDEYLIMGTSFTLRFLGSLLVVLLSTLYSYLRDTPSQTFIVFLVSTSIILQSFSVVDFYFQSKVKGKFSAINQLITLLCSSTIKIIFIIIKAPVEFFAAMVLFEASLSAFNQFLFYKRDGGKIVLWSFSIAEAKVILAHAWPLILSGLILVIYQKMDQILIKRFLDVSMVGQYSASIRITEATYFIPVAICIAVFPGILNSKGNREFQLVRLKQLYSLLLYTAFAITIGGLLFGDWIIKMIYGTQYVLSPEIFKIHIWAIIPVFYGTAWGMWMLSENKQIYLLIYQLVSLAICLLLNLKLIPQIGVTGAAYAIVLTYYFGLMITAFLYKPKETFYVLLQSLHIKNIPAIIKYVKENKSK